MIVTIKDLKKGDLLLSPSNGRFIMIVVLQDPKIKMNLKTGEPQLMWDNKTVRYSNLRVSCNREVKLVPINWGGREHMRQEIIFNCTPDGHNFKKYIQPNHRDFWLLERGLPTI